MGNAIWFILAAAGIALSFLFDSPYAAFALYAFLLLVAIAHFSSLAWLSGLDAQRAISSTVVQAGEEVEVSVSIRNERGWPIPWLFVEDHGPTDFPVLGLNRRLAILMPGREIGLKYRLVCTRRGYHRVGPVVLESGDLFGLQRRFRTGETQDYVSVLPTVAYIDTFNISARRPQGPVRITSQLYADPTRIHSIREYVPGDPMNTIHWKATARTGQLHVKTHEPTTVVGATVVLDLHEESYVPEGKEERMELAITTAASVAYLLHMSGEQIGLLTNAGDAAVVAQFERDATQSLSRQEAQEEIEGELEIDRISPLSVPTMRSPIQAQKILENLARVVPGQGLDATRLLLAAHHTLPRDAALILVVPEADERLALTLASLKDGGFTVTVFLIKNPSRYNAAAAGLAAHHIHCIHIEHERQLHEISPDKIGR